MMIDGLELGKMTILAAMGIDSDGKKHVLGIAESGSENNIVVKGLLEDLIGRGLSPDCPRLYVLDGGKALYKAVLDTFGKSAVIQRCQVHKKRNVLSYLPEPAQANVSIALTMAYREFDYETPKASFLVLPLTLNTNIPSRRRALWRGWRKH